MPQLHPTTGPVRDLAPVRFLARNVKWRVCTHFTAVLFSWSHQATGPVRLDTAVHLYLCQITSRTPQDPIWHPYGYRASPTRNSTVVPRVFHMPVGAVIEWAIAMRFPENWASQGKFSNLKPSSSKKINNNFKQWSKGFHDGKCWLIIGEFDVDSPDKSHAWRLPINMYNLNDFVCCIPQMKREFRASFNHFQWANLALWGICFHVRLISKQIAHPYICSRIGYLVSQLSLAMLLFGFVRTRVLMSRSRLNNGATHGGWHFDIHRDFYTRGR